MMKRTDSPDETKQGRHQGGHPDLGVADEQDTPDEQERNKRQRLEPHDEHESAAAILALAEAAHEHQRAGASRRPELSKTAEAAYESQKARAQSQLSVDSDTDAAYYESQGGAEKQPEKGETSARHRGESFESEMSTMSRAYASSTDPQGTSESERPPEEGGDPSSAVQTFPQKLMEMLDNKIVPDAMWWANGGKAFAMDLSKFGDVLHKHFQSAKYASFTRKLNKWGFRKLNTVDVTAPSSVVMYRHDLFLKDKPELLKGMSTKKKKKPKDKDKGKQGKDTKKAPKKKGGPKRDDAEEPKEETDEDLAEDERKPASKSKSKKRKRPSQAQRHAQEEAEPRVGQALAPPPEQQKASEEAEEESVTEEEYEAEDNEQEEKSALYNELQGSPALAGAAFSRRINRVDESESKASDLATDDMRQQIQQQLSVASSIASRRLADQQNIADALPPSPELMREQARRLQGEQASLLRQIGQNRPQGSAQEIALRNMEQRLLLESLIAAETGQQQRQGLQGLPLLQNRLPDTQRRQSLASEILTQRALAYSGQPGNLPNLPGNMSLQERVLAMRDSASRSSSTYSGAGDFSASLANLRRTSLGQVGTSALAGNFPSSSMLGSAGSAGAGSLPSGLFSQRGTSDPNATFQLQRQVGLGSGLGSYGSLASAGLASQSNTSESTASLQLQLQLEQLQQQQRQLGLASAVNPLSSHGLSTSNQQQPQRQHQAQSESQLLTLLRDRQRLEAELLQLQQRRNQNPE